MKPASPFVKAFVAALTAVYFLTNVAFAHKPEANFWQERQNAVNQARGGAQSDELLLASLPASLSNPSQVFKELPTPKVNSISLPGLPAGLSVPAGASELIGSLPAIYGSIRNISVPKGNKDRKTIIHIQDVHLNLEAQENIGKALQELINEKKVDLVALEGAFEPIDLSGFRRFPHQDTIRKVADYLLKENKISGPIHTALTSSQDLPEFVGVDDSVHYQANVETYRQSAAHLKEYKARWADLDRALEQQKATALNPELFAFDQEVRAYHQGRIKLGEHVHLLAKKGELDSNSLKVFLKALELESSLDFAQVESQRTQLLSQLVRKLTKQQTSELLSYCVAYRLGQLHHTDFYQYIQNLCQKNGIPLSRYPAMQIYIRYVLLSEQINPEALLKETRTLEEQGYASLTKNEEENRLIWESRYLELVGKLLDFALTPEEWREYVQLFNRSLDLRSFEAFYKEAEARDNAMSQNLLKAIEQNKSKVAVLVTGGFHSHGMDERLKEAGFTIISFAPKITHADSGTGSEYLSVFTQEKTPLEKLFQGEKLFLTPNPMAGLIEEGPFIIDARSHGSYFVPTGDRVTYDPTSENPDSIVATRKSSHRSVRVSVTSSAGEILKVVYQRAEVPLKSLLLSTPIWEGLYLLGAQPTLLHFVSINIVVSIFLLFKNHHGPFQWPIRKRIAAFDNGLSWEGGYEWVEWWKGPVQMEMTGTPEGEPLAIQEKALRILEKYKWVIGKAGPSLGMKPNENLAVYFKNLGLEKELKDKLRESLEMENWSANAASKRLGISRSTLRGLVKTYGLQRNAPTKDQALRVLQKKHWNIVEAGPELGLTLGVNLAVFFKTLGLEKELKDKLREILEEVNWSFIAASRRLGISDVVIKNLAELFGLQRILTKNQALRVLQKKHWNIRAAGPELGLRPNEDLAVLFKTLGLEKELKDKLRESLKMENWSFTAVAKRWGSHPRTIRRLVETCGLQRSTLTKDQALRILQKKHWNIGQAAPDLGLKHSENIADFFRSLGLEAELKDKMREILEEVNWSFTVASSILGISDVTVKNLTEFYGLMVAADAQYRLEELGLTDAVALLGGDPLRLYQYIRFYHPELSEEQVERLAGAALRGLKPEWQEPDELYSGFHETLDPPQVEAEHPSTDAPSVVITGRVRPGIPLVQVTGAYTRRVVVRQDGTFRIILPLPRIGEANEFQFFAVNLETEKISPPAMLSIRQTGNPLDTDQAYLDLLGLREDLLEGIQQDPARHRFLLRSVEQGLLKHFTYDEKAGLRYLVGRIKTERSSALKAVLGTILKKFGEIVDMEIPLKNPRKQRLYFFQKFILREIRALKAQGVSGIIVALEQGLGKTLISLAFLEDHPAFILTPNSVVSTWTEMASRFLKEPHVEVLSGSFQEREETLTHAGKPHRVTNIEFTRGMTRKRVRLLSRPDGTLVVDEADYLGSRKSQQSQGTRQIQAGFKLLLTATPFKRPGQISSLLGFLTRDPRFGSSRAFTRAFRVESAKDLNALFLLLQRHTLRIRKRDVFEEYDLTKPLENQKDRLPRKVEKPLTEGQFELSPEQTGSILELFTRYQEWSRKHKGHESVEDTQYYRYKEGFFSKREALRQIMNDPAYIGHPGIESPKHLAMDKIVKKELGASPQKPTLNADGTPRKLLIFCRYRAQVEAYMRRYQRYGARAYYGGLPSNAQGHKLNETGDVQYFAVDENDNFRLDGEGRPIPTDKQHGKPMLALDYERILFQNNKDNRIIVATYDTGALGVTFTAADAVVFDDLAQTYRDEYQAADRAHRIDPDRKKYAVNYYWLQAKYAKSFLDRLSPQDRNTYFSMGTYDEVHYDNLRRQARIFHRIMDGIGSDRELVDWNSRFLRNKLPFLFTNINGEGPNEQQSEDEGDMDIENITPDALPPSSILYHWTGSRAWGLAGVFLLEAPTITASNIFLGPVITSILLGLFADYHVYKEQMSGNPDMKTGPPALRFMIHLSIFLLYLTVPPVFSLSSGFNPSALLPLAVVVGIHFLSDLFRLYGGRKSPFSSPALSSELEGLPLVTDNLADLNSCLVSGIAPKETKELPTHNLTALVVPNDREAINIVTRTLREAQERDQHLKDPSSPRQVFVLTPGSRETALPDKLNNLKTDYPDIPIVVVPCEKAMRGVNISRVLNVALNDPGLRDFAGALANRQGHLNIVGFKQGKKKPELSMPYSKFQTPEGEVDIPPSSITVHLIDLIRKEVEAMPLVGSLEDTLQRLFKAGSIALKAA